MSTLCLRARFISPVSYQIEVNCLCMKKFEAYTISSYEFRFDLKREENTAIVSSVKSKKSATKQLCIYFIDD